MEVVIESSQARSLHTVPFLIRFAPELICRLREIFSPDRSVSGEINGVLFGVAESDFAVVQALRLLSSLPSGNEEVGGTKTPLQASLNTILRGALFNAELSGLELLGWFSARTAIGLRKE